MNATSFPGDAYRFVESVIKLVETSKGSERLHLVRSEVVFSAWSVSIANSKEKKSKQDMEKENRELRSTFRDYLIELYPAVKANINNLLYTNNDQLPVSPDKAFSYINTTCKRAFEQIKESVDKGTIGINLSDSDRKAVVEHLKRNVRECETLQREQREDLLLLFGQSLTKYGGFYAPEYIDEALTELALE